MTVDCVLHTLGRESVGFGSVWNDFMPGVMHTPHALIAVCERTPYWVPELQRQLSGDGIAVRACQRLDDIDPVLADWPRCGVVLDFDAAPAPTLAWLARRIHRNVPPPVWLFASAGTAELEWIAREAGATSFRSALISGRELATECRRVLQGSPTTSARPNSPQCVANPPS